MEGALDGEFLVGVDPAARRVTLHVWRAGEAGIHRRTRCQRAEFDARGAALLADADGTRAVTVPAGMWAGAVSASGSLQPIAELLHRS